MTIPDLYRKLLNVGYFTIEDENWKRRLEVIRENIDVNEEEANEIYWCMKVPSNELERTNHTWFFELSRAAASGKDDFIVWVNNKLNEGYLRRGTKAHIKEAMRLLEQSYQFKNARINSLPLNEALFVITQETPSPPTEGVNRAPSIGIGLVRKYYSQLKSH